MNQDRVITAFETLFNELATVVNQNNAKVPWLVAWTIG